MCSAPNDNIIIMNIIRTDIEYTYMHALNSKKLVLNIDKLVLAVIFYDRFQ